MQVSGGTITGVITFAVITSRAGYPTVIIQYSVIPGAFPVGLIVAVDWAGKSIKFRDATSFCSMPLLLSAHRCGLLYTLWLEAWPLRSITAADCRDAFINHRQILTFFKISKMSG
jgi:hypothetical protein